MYDARQRAIRDRKWEIDAARREGQLEGKIEGERDGLIKGLIEGEIKGKIEMIHMLQRLLCSPLSDEKELSAMGLEQLASLTASLQEQLRGRTPS